MLGDVLLGLQRQLNLRHHSGLAGSGHKFIHSCQGFSYIVSQLGVLGNRSLVTMMAFAALVIGTVVAVTWGVDYEV